MLEIASAAICIVDCFYFVEVEFGSIEDSNKAMSKANVISPVGLVCSTIAHTLLTSLIAGRIWWHKRQIFQVMRNRRLACHYNSIIAMMIESGLIIPVFHTIVIAVTVVKTMTVVMVMTTLDIQIISLAPLLIIVRVGLGRTIEKDHINTMTLPPSTGAIGGPMTFATSDASMTAPSGVVSLPHMADDVESAVASRHDPQESGEDFALGTVEPEKPPAL
ncbi:hypothetical protein L218DRAFT_1008814 [Marasmius fiardii PR-910]|nr:hypothetical protein L218DRAFT_1008814 [Marasmius fiardii PR-910]